MKLVIRVGLIWRAVLVCLTSLGFSQAVVNAKDTHEAKAGWAEVEITPPLGIALGGRGGPITAANKVLDPLFAQVLYLQDEKGTGFVLISFDLVGMAHDLSDRIRTAVVGELGVEFNLVVLNCSHTHSGPYMIRDLMAGVGPAPQIEVDYFKTLTEKIILATRTAKSNLQPVTVETFTGKSQIAINRRGKNKLGKTAMLPNTKGPINEDLWVMKLTPLTGSAPAVLFSYACHPVLVYGYAIAAISPDFPGETRKALYGALGASAHVQFVQGTAGNVRPSVVADVENNRFRPAKPEDVKAVGKQLAGDVLGALEGKGKRLSLNIAGAADRPFFSRGQRPPREIYESMAQEKGEYRQAAANYWLKNYDSGNGFAKGDPWPVGLVRLANDQWICLLGGEPCVEWAPKIRSWLDGRNVITWGYCQEGRTYLPTEALLPEGGYEVDECNYTRANTPARFAAGIEEALRRSLKKQAAFIEAN